MIPVVNSAGKALYVLRNRLDNPVEPGKILNQNAVSNAAVTPENPTGAPQAGAGKEYLQKFQEEIPDVDLNYHQIVTTEAPNNGANTWEIKHAIVDLPVDEKLTAARNAARFQLERHIASSDTRFLIIRALAAIWRDSKGLELSVQERADRDEIIRLAKIQQDNDVLLADVEQQISDGAKPDLISLPWAPVADPISKPIG